MPVHKNKGNRNRILDSDEENKEEEGEEDDVDDVDDVDEDEEDEDFREESGKISTLLNGTARVRSVSFTRAALSAKSCCLLVGLWICDILVRIRIRGSLRKEVT